MMFHIVMQIEFFYVLLPKIKFDLIFFKRC